MSKEPLFDVWDSEPLVETRGFTHRQEHMTVSEEWSWIRGWTPANSEIRVFLVYEFFRVRGYSPEEAKQAVLDSINVPGAK